ncbi:MAG: putative RNA methyltransferase [Huintestinicola sp.]
MSCFICPVCSEGLDIQGNSYKCGNGHCFDIAAKGYVNLLVSNHMNAKLPGDNKMMVNARRDFLGKGYYSHLAETVSHAVCEVFRSGTVVDAGCGEGYYTEKIYDSLASAGKKFHLCGFDISKLACGAAASRFRTKNDSEIAAASIFRMPLAQESADVIVTMFAPFCREEYLRVLKKGGYLIMAIPGEEHLFSLKAAVYDEPYKNRVHDYDIPGFELCGVKKTERTILIDSAADIQSLFSMTPYYYKTSEEGHRRVAALTFLETSAQFEVLVYKKL